ncbi:hypothetical protein FRB96_000331 [Tulasnella sp. 330]|nr:hypothetical protein FRB96_000331 [Tulasnella sp. 330]KAG8870660.1 hypothetical protein FRB97_009558 [Tulasnella sp. 331]
MSSFGFSKTTTAAPKFKTLFLVQKLNATTAATTNSTHSPSNPSRVHTLCTRAKTFFINLKSEPTPPPNPPFEYAFPSSSRRIPFFTRRKRNVNTLVTPYILPANPAVQVAENEDDSDVTPTALTSISTSPSSPPIRRIRRKPAPPLTPSLYLLCSSTAATSSKSVNNTWRLSDRRLALLLALERPYLPSDTPNAQDSFDDLSVPTAGVKTHDTVRGEFDLALSPATTPPLSPSHSNSSLSSEASSEEEDDRSPTTSVDEGEHRRKNWSSELELPLSDSPRLPLEEATVLEMGGGALNPISLPAVSEFPRSRQRVRDLRHARDLRRAAAMAMDGVPNGRSEGAVEHPQRELATTAPSPTRCIQPVVPPSPPVRRRTNGPSDAHRTRTRRAEPSPILTGLLNRLYKAESQAMVKGWRHPEDLTFRERFLFGAEVRQRGTGTLTLSTPGNAAILRVHARPEGLYPIRR